MSFAASLLVAMLIEAVVGWPDRLHRIIGHPVTWLGHLVIWLDRSLNREDGSDFSRRITGLIAALEYPLMVLGLRPPKIAAQIQRLGFPRT